ncbi:MAG TPA: response regulator [Spirochaetota bacterium]
MNYILVVDDSSTLRTSIEYALKKFGYQILQSENGAVALDAIREIKKTGGEIRLCVCDVNMPIMDGISFVREFRKDDKFTPVLMLTTESGEEMLKKGKEAGASGWMMKPFKPAELVSVVEKLMH